MKKIRSILALLLFCSLFTGCNGQIDNGESVWRGIRAGMEDLSAITERTDYYDIVAEQELIFQQTQENEEVFPFNIKSAFISMQFYQGEPVQLWREPNVGSSGELLSWDICLYGQDGDRAVVLQGTDSAYGHQGYLDQEGNLYWWENSATIEFPNGKTEKRDTFLKKYSPSGELLFEKQFDYGYNFKTLCQTADGRVYLIISSREGEPGRLGELDPAAGLVTELDAVPLEQYTGNLYLGIFGEKPAMIKFHSQLGGEVTAFGAGGGSEDFIFSLKGTTYVSPKGLSLQDFRILEDESVEILWASREDGKGLWERLRMEKVEKTPIVLRGLTTQGWLTAQINSFNRQSRDYHVVIEDCGQGNDREDFARLTSIQIASGKGPDILYGSLMEDYITGMIEKGALEDLRPYMERSGISEEDYFPFTFGMWRDGDRICGVSPASPSLEGYCIDGFVLGGTQEPDIDTLVDALLSRQEKAVFLKGYDSLRLLELLLKGTDTLWGMVDWEKGSCDFSGELFSKILETARRYGDNGDKGEVSCIAQPRMLMAIYLFDDEAEREKEGEVICGMLFDDGCHAAVTSQSALAVNANSANKEGAWEFISFLLGEEAQSASSGAPAGRRAYGAWVEGEKEKLSDGKKIVMMYTKSLPDGSAETFDERVYTQEDITDEIVEEYTMMMEDARPCPLRTAPILKIIIEEASDYFNGSISAETVSRHVANRVQTYLDEGR